MDALQKSTREEIIETVNKLFNYTDARNWQGLLNEVFTKEVWFDMSSMGGGEPAHLNAEAICRTWEEGLQGINAIHHQGGNYIVTISETMADVFCYAIAIHYKKDAVNGHTREFVGSYELTLQHTDKGWLINRFRYLVKFITGNTDLK